MRASFNPRTLEVYRSQGYLCTTVESYNAAVKRSKDMHGIFDQLALGFGSDIIGIQTTSLGNMQARVAKILASPIYEKWLTRGGKVHVIGWGKGNLHKIINMTRESHPPVDIDPLNRIFNPEES